MPSISDLLNTSPGAGSMSPRRAGNLPPLSDLFGITPEVINAAPQRMRNIPPTIKPKWDIRSGLPEPGLEQVTPEEWLPPGVGMKLAALAKGGIAPLAAGIMKNRGGVWLEDSLPHYMTKKPPINKPSPRLREVADMMSPEQLESIGAVATGPNAESVREMAVMAALRKHYEDPNYLPFLRGNPMVAADMWARGPLKNYVMRDMATEGDPIRALAEQGITSLRSGQIKRLPGAEKQYIIENRGYQGFPPGEIAKTKLGKGWERTADSSVIPIRKNEFGDTVFNFRPHGDGALPPMDEVLSSLRDTVENGIRKGVISPGSAARGNFTVEAAVRLADKERRIAEAAATSPDVFKEYPGTGHKWVQLNRPGQFADESDAMAHSVRGYEPLHLGGSVEYGAGGFPAIESGKAKIFSLRTPSGKPAVTVEVVRDENGAYKISQIKGRANSRPKPEYSQMIEDLKRQFEQQ